MKYVGKDPAIPASGIAGILETQNSTTQFLTGITGTNTILAVLTPAITGYVAGSRFGFVAVNTNTGPATININGQGVTPITKNGVLALASGDIVAGQAYTIIRDNVGNFQLSGGTGGPQAGGVVHENSTVILNNYTMSTGKNGFMVGPLTVANGVLFTIPSGQRMVII